MFKIKFRDSDRLTISLMSLPKKANAATSLTTCVDTVLGWVYMLFRLAVAMVGYQIHHSVWWSIVDFVFPCLACLKWLCFHEVNMTLIRHAFDWFFK